VRQYVIALTAAELRWQLPQKGRMRFSEFIEQLLPNAANACTEPIERFALLVVGPHHMRIDLINPRTQALL
jgi:hypothetical protein